MAHLILIEEPSGDLIDIEVYCSDYCAETSTSYNGWNGAHEIEFDTKCLNCDAVVHGYEGAYV